ncbi:MAG TPA: tRNA(Ile)-lysidine synthetase [Anaerolineaceae bacterium]|nr:tRNA(Ile)-lysidine synthetase [Anaerolineaceae bacterium]
MKCKKCDQKAVINLQHHNISFCKEHFLEWMRVQTERVIQKFHMFTKEERLLVAVSGGKDSLSLWDILWQLGYQADGLYLDLGINDFNNYSSDSAEFTRRFAEERGLQLTSMDIKAQYGESIPEMAARTKRGHTKPCSQCGLVKRYLLNKLALDGRYDAIVTAHNLDDEAAFLFANVTHWSLDYLGRQYPLLPATTGFARKAKPFCQIYERESAAYAILSGINYIYTECPYSDGSKQLRNKRYLNMMEDEQPGFKTQFYLGYLRALKAGAFPQQQESAAKLEEKRCAKCGQPTQSDGLCTFCRLVNK